MRKDFGADWAFGISGALGNFVRNTFPRELRRWPLLQSFSFEAYELPGDYAIFALRDQLQGIVSGPGQLEPFPHSGFPDLPPSVNKIELWHHYLRDTLKLRAEDAPFLVPIHDSGVNVKKDFELFNAEEKSFWDRQLAYVVAHHASVFLDPKDLPALVQTASQPEKVQYESKMDSRQPDGGIRHYTIIKGDVHNHNYTVARDLNQATGNNSRVNKNSTDSSVNIVADQVFDQLRRATNDIPEQAERDKIMTAIAAMENTYGSPSFVDSYKDFIAVASGHLTVFTPVMAMLASLLA
jgi:hypothetical protein